MGLDKGLTHNSMKKTRAYKLPVNIPSVMKVLLITGGPNVRKVLDFFIWEVEAHETLEIFEWSGDRYYFNVLDTRRPSVMGAGRHVMGFTMDLRKDEIILNRNGGNNFVYTEKWIRRIRKNFKGLTFGPRKDYRRIPCDVDVFDYRGLAQ